MAVKHELLREDVGYVKATTYGAALTSATIVKALAAIGATRQTLFLDSGAWTLNTSIVIPATTTLWIPGGTTISVNWGVILTIAGGAEIDGAQVFTGTGTVLFYGGTSVNVSWFGAVGDGSTDDTTAFTRALQAAQRVMVPNPATAYRLTGTLTIPANTWIEGAEKRRTKLQLAHNDVMMILSDGSGVRNLYLEGGSDSFTGGAFALNDTAGRQVIEHVRAVNFQGPILAIATSAGSQMSAVDVEMHRWDPATHAAAVTASELYAVVIDPTQQLTAVPRKFSHIETNGAPSFDYGGGNGTFLNDSFVGDMKFTAETRGVHISNVRWANQAQVHLQGHNNTIVGSGIAPELVLDSGTDDWAILGNSLNNGLTDNSGNGRNRVSYIASAFSPNWDASAGTNPSLGDGTLRAMHSRIGSHLQVTYELIMGSTTTYGDAGAWRFDLPNGVQFYSSGNVLPQIQLGIGYAVQSSTGTVVLVVPGLVQDSTVITMYLAGIGGQVTYNQPWAWAVGDTLRFTLNYDVGK